LHPVRKLLALAASRSIGAGSAGIDRPAAGPEPVLTVQRNVCPDGMASRATPRRTLSADADHLERITLPGGSDPARLITRYGQLRHAGHAGAG
jgi:hypothetical protein